MTQACPRCGAARPEAGACPQCGADVARLPASPFARPPAAAARAQDPPVSPFARRAAGPEPPSRSRGGPAGVPGVSPSRRFTFHGAGSALFGIQVVNAFLTLLTLGVYFFWARTKVRAWTLSHLELEGDRFAYHGTGRELFIGTCKAILVFFVPVLLLNVLPELLGAPAEVRQVAGLLVTILVMIFIPVAWVGARRYRLGRTSWRGIRFSFRGDAREFIWLFLRGTILSFATLGLYYPVFITERQAFLVSQSYFGSARFGFDGRGRDLVRPFVVAILLFPFTLGISWFWFSAARQRLFADHTWIGQARFHSTVTGGRLAWLMVSNLLLLLVTLGVAWPWVTVRSLRFTARYVTLDGPVDLAAVRQEAQAVSATGEGLAGFFDTDLGVG